jgi:hypothetical protein
MRVGEGLDDREKIRDDGGGRTRGKGREERD